MAKSHNDSFSETERRLLGIIRSLQNELIEAKSQLAAKDALLLEARSQLQDVINWGKYLLDDNLHQICLDKSNQHVIIPSEISSCSS